MQSFSQLDARWSSDKIGRSSLTIGRWGCCISSIAMIATYFGEVITPPELAHNVANFTPDGLVDWGKIKLKTMKFDARERKLNKERIALYLKDPNKAVILNVNGGAHWVVGIRKTLLGDSYVVLDPWGGVKVDVVKKYRNVVGAAYFSRK